MSKLLFLAAILGLAISSVAQSPPPPPSPTERGEKEKDISTIEHPQSQPAYTPPQATSALPHQLASPPAQRNTNEKTSVGSYSPAVNWTFGITNTILLLLFNGILAVVAVYQYLLTLRQADSIRTIQRAIVVIDNVDATTPIGSSGFDVSSVIIITLKNFGQTIAYEVELAGILCGSGHIPIEKLPAATIAPQGDKSWFTKPISSFAAPDIIQRINSGTWYLGYKIDVTYRDAFNVTHKYHCEGRYEPLVKRFLVVESKTD